MTLGIIMGFWKSLGNGIREINEKYQYDKEHEENLYNRYQSYDDKTLRSRARGEGFTDIHEARQATRVLRERGKRW